MSYYITNAKNRRKEKNGGAVVCVFGCGGVAGAIGCGHTAIRGTHVITIVYQILLELLSLYKWAVILAALFSMLVSFGVLDTRNRVVWTIGDFLYRITEPVLRPIRNRLPSTGGLDLSPIVVIFGIWVAQEVLQRLYMAIAFGQMSGLLL